MRVDGAFDQLGVVVVDCVDVCVRVDVFGDEDLADLRAEIGVGVKFFICLSDGFARRRDGVESVVAWVDEDVEFGVFESIVRCMRVAAFVSSCVYVVGCERMCVILAVTMLMAWWMVVMCWVAACRAPSESGRSPEVRAPISKSIWSPPLSTGS